MLRPVAAGARLDAAVPFRIGDFVLADGEGERDPHLMRGLLIGMLARSHLERAVRHHHERRAKVAILEFEACWRCRGGLRQRRRDRVRFATRWFCAGGAGSAGDTSGERFARISAGGV